MSAKEHRDAPVTVSVPDELPEITPAVGRILLAILVEATTTPGGEDTTDDNR